MNPITRGVPFGRRSPLQGGPFSTPKHNRSSPRDYDRELYAARHLIENFFAKIKQFRAIATRYEKTAQNFLAAVQLVASIVWLN